MLLLLSCWIVAGITAEDPPKRHYGVKNNSLCLHVRHSPPFQEHKWLFNANVIVLMKTVTPKYVDKVVYNPSDHSLCINNLTEADDGAYEFAFVTSDFESLKETHKLIVQEPIPTPVMRMSNLSTGLCNITVNCSIQDDWMWSICEADGCRTSQKSLHKVTISIFTSSRSIVCSGNNHAMESNVSESIAAVCFRQSSPEHEEASQPPRLIIIILIIIIAVAVCVSLLAFALFLTKSLTSSGCVQHQTAERQRVEEQPQSVQRALSSSSSQAEACYENMDAVESQHNSRTGEDKQSQDVQTVYSVLQAQNVTSCQGKSHKGEDGKGSEVPREACASQRVEAERPDTLYSVLQKPITLESQRHQ